MPRTGAHGDVRKVASVRVSPHNLDRLSRAARGSVWAVLVVVAAVGLFALSVVASGGVLTAQALYAKTADGLGAGLLGTVATVTVLERLRERRTSRAERLEVIARLVSRDLGTVRATAEQLRSTNRLQSGYLDRAILRGAILSGCDLRRMRAVAADLSGADLSGTDLYDADLRWCNLADAKLTEETNLRLARLDYANLAGIPPETLRLAGALEQRDAARP